MEKGLRKIRPVPWLTELAIEFLDNYLINECNGSALVLEFGCGASTIWISKRAARVVSIEHKKKWLDRISKVVEGNVDLRLEAIPYYSVCDGFNDGEFDLVLIDGRNRVSCCRKAKRLVRHGGILMLDNAERGKYSAIYKLLSNWELTIGKQNGIDQYGFYYKGWTTSWWRNVE